MLVLLSLFLARSLLYGMIGWDRRGISYRRRLWRNGRGESFRTFLVGEFIGRDRGKLETRRENCQHRLVRPRSDQWVRSDSILLLVLELVNDNTRNSIGHSFHLVFLCLFIFLLPSYYSILVCWFIVSHFFFSVLRLMHSMGKQKRRKSGFTRDIRNFGWDEKERSRLYDGRWRVRDVTCITLA